MPSLTMLLGVALVGGCEHLPCKASHRRGGAHFGLESVFLSRSKIKVRERRTLCVMYFVFVLIRMRFIYFP